MLSVSSLCKLSESNPSQICFHLPVEVLLKIDLSFCMLISCNFESVLFMFSVVFLSKSKMKTEPELCLIALKTICFVSNGDQFYSAF